MQTLYKDPVVVQYAFTASYHEPVKPLEAYEVQCASLGFEPVAAVAVMQIPLSAESLWNALCIW